MPKLTTSPRVRTTTPAPAPAPPPKPETNPGKPEKPEAKGELPEFHLVDAPPKVRLEIAGLVDRIRQVQVEIRWAKLALQGDEHAESKWYKDQPGHAPVIGLLNELESLMLSHGIQGFRLNDQEVYRVEAESSRLSKPRLLELGVDASIIAAATTHTPYTAMIVRERKTK